MVTVPPSMRSAWPWMSASATFRRATSMIRANVGREIFICAAAGAWYNPCKSARRKVSTSSSVKVTCSNVHAGTPAGLKYTATGV